MKAGKWPGGYINKPYRKPNAGIWYETGGEWRNRVHVAPYRGHWTQSIEKRPSKAQLVEWVLNGAVVV